MKAALLSIGNEVLAGFTVNSNVAFISRRLEEIGITVQRQVVVSDEEGEIQSSMRQLLEEFPLVITTGGLGPTCDDRTRFVLADLFGAPLKKNQAVADELEARFQEGLLSLEDQALVPEGAAVFHNRVGTAPGLALQSERSLLIALQGVPYEMEQMMVEQVVPYLEEHCGGRLPVYRRSIHLCRIPENRVDPLLRELMVEHPTVEFGIYPGTGVVTLLLTTQDGDAALVEPFERLMNAFSSHVVESEQGTVEGAVKEYFIKHGLTLSTAESCTGGAVAAQMVTVPGVSECFLGGVTVYSNELKRGLLEVDQDLITAKGAVSSEVVSQMATRIKEKTGSDYSLACSGFLGPKPSDGGMPLGTTWGAIGRPNGEPYVWKFISHGRERKASVAYSVNHLLGTLYLLASGKLFGEDVR